MGAPHPRSLRCLLPKHNLLTEGGHGPPPSLARQQCPEDRRRRKVPSDFHDEIAARPRPHRTELQRVLRRIHARIAVVATRDRFFPDSVQVFTKAPVPGEHLRHPVNRGGERPRPTKRPSLEGQPREPLAPARPLSFRGWHAICRAGPVEPDPHYPDGHRPVQPPDLQETAAAGHQVLCPDRSSIKEPRSHHSRRTPTPGPPSRGSKRPNAFAVTSTDGARRSK